MTASARIAERPAAWAADPATFDINKLDPRFLDDPFPTYAALRRHSPVHRNSDGSFLATRYAEVELILRDPRMSSDQREAWRARLGEFDWVILAVPAVFVPWAMKSPNVRISQVMKLNGFPCA